MRNVWLALFSLWLAGCAGFERGCSSEVATSFGADWIVVQQRATDGKPYNCWLLQNVSVANEGHSDGVYWASSDGHLVHIAGQYARVQVKDGKWKNAAHLIGIDSELCREGAYPYMNPSTTTE